MATARLDFKQQLFADLRNNASLVALLGPVSSTNYRIYSGWPQMQPGLTGYEPAEGWIVFTDNASPMALAEDHNVQLDIWSTRNSVNEQVLGLLDSLWHRSGSDQDGWLVTSDWVVTVSRRLSAQDLYEPEVKLYRTLTRWLFRTQKIPYRAGV